MNIRTIDKKLEQLESFIDGLTAIFYEDDYIALSTIKTLITLGYRIPNDISVFGFDDISECSVTIPELTTVHVSIKEIAKEAIEMIERNTTPAEPFLLIQASCEESL